MMFIIIAIAAFVISGITLFSGFGLGTVLMPVFAIFFPVPIAISLTAIVHFLNNLFKLFLVGKKADKEVLIKFGVPAFLAAIAGGLILSYLTDKSFKVNYQIMTHSFNVELVNFILGFLILFFVIIELLPQTNKLSINKKYLPAGGVLSGFFGGLSGNQGAFRSIFLLKCNMTSEVFIATGVILSCIVDTARIFVYGAGFLGSAVLENLPLLITAILSAFLGAYLSKKYMHKVTINFIRVLIVIMLLSISIGLILGYI